MSSTTRSSQRSRTRAIASHRRGQSLRLSVSQSLSLSVSLGRPPGLPAAFWLAPEPGGAACGERFARRLLRRGVAFDHFNFNLIRYSSICLEVQYSTVRYVYSTVQYIYSILQYTYKYSMYSTTRVDYCTVYTRYSTVHSAVVHTVSNHCIHCKL